MSDEKVNMSVFDKIIGVIKDHNEKEQQLYQYFNEIGNKLTDLTDAVKEISDNQSEDTPQSDLYDNHQKNRLFATKKDTQVKSNVVGQSTLKNVADIKKVKMDSPLDLMSAGAGKIDISHFGEFADDIKLTDKIIKGLNEKFKFLTSTTKEAAELQQKANKSKTGDALNLFGNKSVKNDKGFIASMRRGMVDPDKDLGPEKGFMGKIGRGLGSMIASDGMSMQERRGYGRVTYQAEAADERLASGDKEAQKTPLAHEQRQLDELRSHVKQGNINTGNLSEDAYMEKAQKELITKNNEDARRRGGFSPKAKVFNEVKEPAIDKIDGQPVEQKKELASVDDLIRNKFKPRKKQDQQQVESSQPKEASHARQNFVSSNKTGTMNVTTLNVGAMNVAGELAKKEEPTAEGEEKKTPFKFGKPNVTKWGEIGKAGTQPVAVGTPDKLNLENLTIAKLTVETLIANKTEGNTGGESSPQAADGDGISIPDVNLGRTGSKGGKALGMLGKGAKLMGKLALPIAAGMTIMDGVSGYQNANENLGIQGREATFGEKMSSAAGSVASGLTLGMIDAKTASGAIKSFTGAGPDVNAANAVEPATREYGNLVDPRTINPVVSPQHAELGTVSEENYSLKEQERVAASQAHGNISISAPTSISSSSGGGGSMPSVIRPSNTAYERFVDRVFTAM